MVHFENIYFENNSISKDPLVASMIIWLKGGRLLNDYQSGNLLVLIRKSYNFNSRIIFWSHRLIILIPVVWCDVFITYNVSLKNKSKTLQKIKKSQLIWEIHTLFQKHYGRVSSVHFEALTMIKIKVQVLQQAKNHSW